MFLILKQLLNILRLKYYLSLYFKELKKVADSRFETTKDFAITMGFPVLSKIFDITREIQRSKFNIDITYEEFKDHFYTFHFNHLETKYWVIRKYGINTWKLFLRSGGIEQEDSPTQTMEAHTPPESIDSKDYTNEIQKHLHDLGCQFTTHGYISALALKHDRSAIDQAVSFYITAIIDQYLQLDQLDFIRSVTEGSVFIFETSIKIKNYYDNGKISKFAYQSATSILSLCLKIKRTEEEKAVLESLRNQNYLGGEKLVFMAS